MVIPVALLNQLREILNNCSERTRAGIMNYLRIVDWSDIEAAREAVVMAVQEILEATTGVAGQAGADFYDTLREQSTGERLGAMSLPGYVPEATEGAIRAFVSKIVKDGNVDAFNNLVLQRVDYEIKKAAANSIVSNGYRDPMELRFARVPSGSETCSFCIMLASRGFVYHSKEKAGGVDHFHANCDCIIVPGFPDTEIEGYDPDALYDQYLEDLKTGKMTREGLARSAAKAKGKHGGSGSGSGGRLVNWDYKARWPNYEDRAAYLEGSVDLDDFDKRCKELIADMKKEYTNPKSYDAAFTSLRFTAKRVHQRLTVSKT